MNTLKSRGYRTDRCGAPEKTLKGDEKVSELLTEEIRLVR
jgi:hypothetical protein